LGSEGVRERVAKYSKSHVIILPLLLSYLLYIETPKHISKVLLNTGVF